ncbi:MAG: NAD(P)-dependent oxidoreductase [Woeseiaceae bacterium]|nr:NAD(P)-dependent oxidoreductase [Woeseiaceae bacterium]
MAMRLAFIGLGVMGYPMAGHLSRAGHDVVVYNRTTAKAEKWCREYKGRLEKTPGAATRDADMVLACVGNDDDLRSVMLGESGVVASISSNALIVDHTTTSANVAREIAAAAAACDAGFIDAPVSGGQAGAENGQLTIMAGGDNESVARAQAVLTAYAKAVTHIGPVGSGQLAKMVNQICIAGVVQGLSEGLHFAMRSGLDTEKVINAISAGAAQSWQMENRWKTMVEGQFDFGFAIDWMRKDLGIALDEAKQNGARLELTELVDRFYAELQATGGNRWDTSSLIARLEKKP